jgi:hypothetical protein
MGFPERPLYLAAGIGYIFWFSFALSMIIAGGTHERPLPSDWFTHSAIL